MKLNGEIKLDIRKNQKRKNGYPLVASVTRNGKRKVITFGLNFEKEKWDFEKQEPKSDKRVILLVRKKKVLLDELIFNSYSDNSITLDYVKKVLLGNLDDVSGDADFYQFGRDLKNEFLSQTDEKGVQKKGNARVYENAIAQFEFYRKSLRFSELDYSLLLGFRNWQLSKGNKKSTINAYFRTYRAIYNEGVCRFGFEDKKPFKDVFKGVSVKRNRTKKRHISKIVLKILEEYKGLPVGQQLAVDMWLLQFYFGGQDFKDVYYLESYQLSAGRVYFTRGKLDENGYQFDLKVFEKAKKIIDKYRVDDRFLFPWRKDYDGYRSFLRRVQRNLLIVQKKYNDKIDEENPNVSEDKKPQKIVIQPLGGNLTPKVSRHTFATIGARMFVEPDLLRALMGHERDDVDTIYKDVYPQEVRDEWHGKIISTD